MTDHKFTDDEIIKALKCCIEADCNICPFWKEGIIGCHIRRMREALALINRQKAENEWLNKEVDRLSQCVLYHDGIVSDLEKDVFNAKSEAIKEFAERLKVKVESIPQYHFNLLQVEDDINTLVKEMTEGE